MASELLQMLRGGVFQNYLKALEANRKLNPESDPRQKELLAKLGINLRIGYEQPLP
jgi:hypothetical protein